MPGSLSIVDILFVVTIILLVLHGLRVGFVFSLVNLLSLPVAAGLAWFFGPSFTNWLETHGMVVNPLVSYIILFLISIIVIHAIGGTIGRTVKGIPLISSADALGGGVVGFVEAWLLWLVFLLLLGHFLNITDQAQIQQLGFKISTFHSWQQFYNDAISNSLFARVNGWFIQHVPLVPVLK